MTQDVRQWLAEIKSLQQKLIEVHQERDEAYASASKWRSLYETEAKQRRMDASLARQTIDTLRSEIDRSQGLPTMPAESSTDRSLIQQEVLQLQTTAELQERLTQVLIECDRLSQALKVEQAEHTKTRKSLTTALGDTVDRLTKERASRQEGVEFNAPSQNPAGASAQMNDPKNPLPELPRLD
jgi:crotonobetainyl-CoA:carnitine CoA-transferase CaiB-like acyl-CoA transferase